MPSLGEFLRHVLPEYGWKVSTYIGPKSAGGKPPVRNQFHATFEELEASLRNAPPGRDVYFAVGTYQDRNAGRTQKNSYNIQSLWLDIDVGPHHSKPSKYADVKEAAGALRKFIDHQGLPKPTCVVTGGGLHVYWTLDAALTPAEWAPLAKGLEAAAVAFGLDVDKGISTDSARIMRAPETFNMKIPGQPRPCTVANIAAKLPVANLTPRASAPAQPAVADIHLGDMGAAPQEPSSGAMVADHCAQLRAFRDTRSVTTPEPLWYALLGVLSHCPDGAPLAQEWSSGHPGYSPEATDAKFIQAKDKAGPTTCARFQSLEPSLCQGCPHTCKSPIQLGRGLVVTPPAVAAPDAPGVAIDAMGMPQLPWGFNWSKSKLVRMQPSKIAGDPDIEVVISTYPIYLDSIQRSERSGGTALAFRHWLPHEGWQAFTVTAKEFAGQSRAAVLADHGVCIHDGVIAHFVAYVQKAQDAIRAIQRDQMRYDQMGWKADDTGFLLGHELFKDGVASRVPGGDEVTKRAKMMTARGTLQGWKEAANQLFAKGCEPQSVALLASLAAPLMKFVAPPSEGGGVVALHSDGTGTGKSTSLAGVASVWGELDAIKVIMKDSAASKFIKLGALRHLPVVFEEFRSADPDVVRDFILDFSTGRAKEKAHRDGLSTMATVQDWQTIMITASNISLHDILSSGTGEDAQAARVLELTLEPPKDVVFLQGDQLRRDLEANSGQAGREFIGFILGKLGPVKTRALVLELAAYYQKVLGATTQHRYIVWMMACIALAAKIAQRIGLLEFSPERILDWLVEKAKDNMGMDNAPRTEEEKAAATVNMVFGILNKRMNEALVVSEGFRAGVNVIPRRTPLGPLNIRIETGPRRLYVAAGAITNWLTDTRKSTRRVMHTLMDQGVLISHTKLITLGAGTDLATGQVRTWVFDLNHPMASGQVREVADLSTVAL